MKRLTPLHKCGAKIDVNDFRTISIFCIHMKIFEKIIDDQIYDFIEDSKILFDRQSSFRKLYSTNTAVVDVSDYIL